MEDWIGDAEIHFDKCHGGEKPNGFEAAGKGADSGVFFAGASNQISLMKWIMLWNRTSREQRHPCLCSLEPPSLAVPL